MPENADSTKIYLGRGKLYLDRLTAAGVRTGGHFVGNCTTFQVTPNVEKIEMFSSTEKGAPLLASDVTRQRFELEARLHEFSKENLALALLGDTATLAQSAGGPVTNETLVAKKDHYFQLGATEATKRRAVTSVVVTNVGGATVYVLNTDYKLDALRGEVYIMSTGAITEGQTLEVDYSFSAITTGDVVRAGTFGSIDAFVRFIGDPKRGPAVEVEVWKCSFSPDAALGLISDEYGGITLKGNVLADPVNHPAEPSFRVLYL